MIGEATRRVLRTLLALALPSDTRGAVLTELDDVFGDDSRGYRREALRSLPHAMRLRVRRWRLGGLAGDLRQGVRALRASPWFLASSTSVIGLSVAFGVTAFAIVDGALFRPLPYPHEDRLFVVSQEFTALPPRATGLSSSLAEVAAWEAALPGAVFGTASHGDRAVLSTTEGVNSSRVSPTYLDVLGIVPLFGDFLPEDFEALLPVRPALLTHGLWMSRFGGDPAVVGRSFIDDQGRGIRVVGVLPPRFVMPGPWSSQVLTPLVERSAQPHARNTSAVVVRLPDDLSRDEAHARLVAATHQLASDWPPVAASSRMTEAGRIASGPADAVRFKSIREELTIGLWDLSLVVLVGALCLVALACVNVASLAVARVHDRWRDLAVRRALGARASDIFRLLAAEHAVVVTMGVTLGTLAAQSLLRVTLDLMPPYLLLQDAVMDVRVLAFASVLATACLSAIAAVSTRVAVSRHTLRAAVADGVTVTSRRRPWFVAVQVALATVVMIASSLVVGSLLRVQAEDVGLAVEGRAHFQMGAPRGSTGQQIEALLRSLGELPDVARIGATDRLVLQRSLTDSVFDAPEGMVRSGAGSFAVTSGYLEAAGIRLIEGRFPTEGELVSGAPVVVMSTTSARIYWPDGLAIGRHLTLNGRPFVVVGLVEDARYTMWDLDPVGDMYFPMTAAPRPITATVIAELRQGVTPAAAADAFVRLCPDCRVYSSQWMAETLAASIQGRRFRGWLFFGFGAVALIITGVGILGTVAMATARRVRELGIRIALGATRPAVVTQIVREQGFALAVGMFAGGAVAAGVVRVLASYLYKTELYDPLVWSTAVLALLSVATVAALLPSVRASRVDVVRALKAE